MAVSLLTGLATGTLALAVSSFVFYKRYAIQFPDDTQNLLSALTSSMLVGIGVFVVAAIAAAGIYLVLGLRRPRT